MEQVVSMPRIGDQAPAFEAQTTMGPIKFPEEYLTEKGLSALE